MGRKLLLLTGGIGVGKSEVGRLLSARGACVIDADHLGHQVLEMDGEAHESVARAFPNAIVEGVIDRGLLAREVFGDPERLRLLESLTHPAIRERILRQVETSDADVVVVELPLVVDFLDEGWLRVVVDAPEDLRLERLEKRGMRPVDAKARMLAQPQPDEWRAAANFLVDNSGDREALEAEVDRLWEWLSKQ
jgi:dephospho-CoA kinase